MPRVAPWACDGSKREFSRFLAIANGSLHETKCHLAEAHDRGYLDDERYDRLLRLCLRTLKASNRLVRYLKTAEAPNARG